MYKKNGPGGQEAVKVPHLFKMIARFILALLSGLIYFTLVFFIRILIFLRVLRPLALSDKSPNN